MDFGWPNAEIGQKMANGRLLFLALLVYYIKLKSHLPVCLSVCPDRHADISAVSAWIEMGLAPNESSAFWDNQVCFKKSLCPITHPDKCAKGTGVSQNSH